MVIVHELSRPAGDLALYRAEMAGWPGPDPRDRRQAQRARVRANDSCRQDILDRLGSAGPLPSRDLPDTCRVPWLGLDVALPG